MKVKSLSHVRLLATPWTVAHQAPPSMRFSLQLLITHSSLDNIPKYEKEILHVIESILLLYRYIIQSHNFICHLENTGVGCHFLLQCMKVKSESEVTESCPTLSDPMDCSLPGSSVHGIFQARVLEWGAVAFSASMS